MSEYHLESSVPRKRQSFSTNFSQQQTGQYFNGTTNILSDLDTNIPSASSMKRKRLSLLPKNVNIGAPRLLNQPSAQKRQSSFGLSQHAPSVQDLVQRSLTRTGIPAPGSVNRRRSLAQHQPPPSSNGRLFENSVVNTPGAHYMTPTQPRDPRPLRDRNFQLKMQQELYAFLSTNKFDIEMKHPLTNKTLKNPTQKDFVLMFQWLYKKIDPGYKFLRSIEQEVYSLLKFLEYPYLDTINKSQISAVGGSNWHVFLGMLYWLRQLVGESLNLDTVDLDNFQEAQSLPQNNSFLYDDSINDSVVMREQDLVDKLFTKYALKSYKLYMSTGGSNFDSYYKEMEKEYHGFLKEVTQRLHSIEEENNELNSKVENLSTQEAKMRANHEKSRLLELDVSRYQAFIDAQMQKKLKWPTTIMKIEKDIESIKEKLAKSEEAKSQILSGLSSKNFTVQAIEMMHRERSQLAKDIDSVVDKSNSVQKTVNEKFLSLRKAYEGLEKLIDSYNSYMYNLLHSITFKELPQITITGFTEEVINDDSKLGRKPDEIIPQLKELNVRTNLTVLKYDLVEAHRKNQDTLIKLHEQLDSQQQELTAKEYAIHDLESELASFQAIDKDTKEQLEYELSTKDAEVEADQSTIRNLQKRMLADRKAVEARHFKAKAELDKFKSDLKYQYFSFFHRIGDCMNQTLNFKNDITASLESMNTKIVNEYQEHIELSKLKYV
ncbi:hypothetical protein KL905_001759 [Ogataea polymorpha]|uniref:uncharacterized protein n=1 Tax=Ogataea polymorpha TaxID=460523 RepID=UPI0007F3B2BE|nr:uncharacterized protein OGAPODRAFT_94769 [Ogataea polymorpha]KAG7908318.1 hypothetical protein KL907_001808 [Ogataea polymorpha]KAG7908952.1 hypothetical protein KL906_003183 [Ogataea polymorpha]KAG7921071.1 hypothetical protein KL927_000315 [Ogataea polymorpha]KAG7922538.1 hypothetical protein KL905_001759 [Ogataea polymorpha]KAG7939293.1 hypothetical protein KL934_000227 [Ogataea polymorpha]